MKIVLDLRSVHPGMTGIGRYASNLLVSLQRTGGVNVEAIVTEAGRAYLRGIVSAPFHVFSREDSIRDEATIPELLSDVKADVFHSPLFVLPNRKVCRYVATVHDVIPLARPDLCPETFRTFFGRHLGPALRAADHVVTVSEHSRADILRFVNVPPSKVTAVHEPISPIFAEPKQSDAGSLMRSFGIAPGFFLFVGAIDRRKNLPRLIEAYAGLKFTDCSIPPLVIVGGPSGDGLDIHPIVEGLGLGADVVQLGRVSDEALVLLYQSAGIFVFPSLYEGFGLPVVEAMACGTPVVTSETTSLPEIAGDAALLVDPENPESISEALGSLLRDESLRERLSRKGKERAAVFTQESQGRRLLALYEELLREAA